jgi:parvulin-like peptidyl-prolyl isomerase
MHRRFHGRPGSPRWGTSAVFLFAFIGMFWVLVGCQPSVDFTPLPVTPEQTLVVLNGEPLSLEEFDSEFRLMAIHYGAVGEYEMRTTKRRLFDQIVDRHILVQRALELGIGVSRRELEKTLRDALHDAPPGYLGLLKNQGVGEEAWKNKMAQEVLVSKLAEQEVYPKAKVSDAEVEDYYWAHLDDFWLPESVHVRHLVVRNPRELLKAQASLKSGELFAKVCSLFSVDPQSESGGDWGWIPLDSLAPIYVRTLRAMRPGEVSKPIKDAFGYHLFLLLEIRPTRVRSLKEASPDVRDLLLKREKDRIFVEWLDNLKKTAKIEINPDLATVVGVVLEDSHVVVPKAKIRKPVRKAVHH